MTKIVPATTYTPLPPEKERFSPNCYAWLTEPKPEPLHVKEMLPAGDREHLMRLWEDTEQKVKDQRYPDQVDFANADKQMGKVLHSSEFVKRILKLNKDLIVEDSNAVKGCAAFYLVKNGERKYTNASFKKGWIPEFSIIHPDRADLPVRIDYGWRTCLVRLLKFNAITWQNVLDVFGDVKYSDSRGRHWAHNVAAYR